MQYTSRGLGTNVFWFRINCPPEITIFKLKSPYITEEK
jgi:predicted MPP superfamily phosphohydrolase